MSIVVLEPMFTLVLSLLLFTTIKHYSKNEITRVINIFKSNQQNVFKHNLKISPKNNLT